MSESPPCPTRRSIVLGFALASTLAAAGPDSSATRESAKMIEAGRYREALTLLEKGPAPSEAESRVLLGRTYLGLGRYADAEAILSSPGPSASEPARLAALSPVSEVRGDLDRALALMNQAVEAKRASLGSAESLDGANALADYRTLLGGLAFRIGRLDVAKDQFQKAISLVGDAHAKLHALDIPHDERDPRLFAGEATAGLARVYGAQGDAARAERSWRGVMARTDDPTILAGLVAFYRARNDEKSARRHLDRALKLSKGKPAHRRTRALLLAESQATAGEALGLAEAVYKDGPGVQARDTLAWVLHLQGNDVRAEAILRPVLEHGSRDPLVLYHAGRIALTRGKADDAKRLLSGSLELNPGFDPVLSRDARTQLEQLRK